MIKVVKGNVVLRVEDEMLDYYVDRGYTAKTLDGVIIKEAVPTDAASLKKAYIEIKKEVKALQEENDTLKKEIASLKTVKAEKPVVDADEPTVSEEKPKRTRRKSVTEV